MLSSRRATSMVSALVGQLWPSHNLTKSWINGLQVIGYCSFSGDHCQITQARTAADLMHSANTTTANAEVAWELSTSSRWPVLSPSAALAGASDIIVVPGFSVQLATPRARSVLQRYTAHGANTSVGGCVDVRRRSPRQALLSLFNGVDARRVTSLCRLESRSARRRHHQPGP